MALLRETSRSRSVWKDLCVTIRAIYIVEIHFLIYISRVYFRSVKSFNDDITGFSDFKLGTYYGFSCSI